MSNAPLEYARPIFEEHQRLRLGRGMQVTIISMAILGAVACAVLFVLFHNPLVRAAAGLILLAGVVGFVLPYFVLPGMSTRVDGEGLHVRFGTVPWQTITAGTIAAAEPCTFDARKEFGGWGMRLRVRGREDCYTIGGAEGVRFTMRDGDRVVVGSERSDELAAAVRSLLGQPSSAAADAGVTRTE